MIAVGVDEVVSEVGLWWPAADEDGLRAAATAWRRAGDGLENATAVGRSGAALARTSWRGEAAERHDEHWRRHEETLIGDVAACRALADALLRFADAVADAKRQVAELAVAAGATIVAGVGLAWLTFGASAATAAAVSAGLIASAQAIGVALSATTASILAGALTGLAFGAVEAAAVDLAVAQPLRVEAFGRDGYSVDEAVGAATAGGVAGGAIGGVLGGLSRGVPTPGTPAAPGSVADDLGALDSAISAALDPARRGALGPLFRPGVHDAPGAVLAPEQLPAARLLADEGHSLHPPAGAAAGDGVMLRSSATDRGRPTELAVPEAPTVDAVENAIVEAGGRLARQGSGDLVLDGRALGWDVDAAGEGLAAAVERARAQGLDLPDSVRFVFDDGSIHYP